MTENQKQIKSLQEAKERVLVQAREQGRGLNEVERKLLLDIEEALQDLGFEEAWPGDASRSLTVEMSDGSSNRPRRGRAFALRAPGDSLDYRAMFGGDAGSRWDARGEGDTFFGALFSGRHDPRLISSGMSTGVPSEGGFLVPAETAGEIHKISLENEVIMPRAFVQPMSSNELAIPAMTGGSHQSHLYGGFVASYTPEGGTIPENNPTVREIRLKTNKLTGLLRFSNELVTDMAGGVNQLIRIAGQGLAWYRDRAFLKGTGAGEPLGILNAPCTITADAVADQGANTIVYANVLTMMSHLHPGGFKNAVWLAHVSTLPQLGSLFVPIGNDYGSAVPVLNESSGEFRLLGLPVIFTEKCEPLGSRGDLILADLSQYVIGLRSGMRVDTSIHPGFLQDQLMARLIERHDGQPLWDAPLVLEDGTTEVSPFVVLSGTRT